MVVAVDTEPSVVPEERPVFIKNRVSLGHQPKADTIEVISYNEQAGRFEFQVVSDYREGGEPKVEYAKRALCMSCHQSGGPIFFSFPLGGNQQQPGNCQGAGRTWHAPRVCTDLSIQS